MQQGVSIQQGTSCQLGKLETKDVHFETCSNTYDKLLTKNIIFIIMGNFRDFGKIQFRLSQPKLSLNWEAGNLPK